MSYYIKQGYWRNYHEPLIKQGIITVTDFCALLFSALVGIFISFVGSQGWIIVRRFVLWLMARPNRHPPSLDIPLEPTSSSSSEPDDPLPVETEAHNQHEDFDREDISQKDAILVWLGSRRKRYRHRAVLDSPKKRFLLGLTAILWLGIWLTLGPAAVYILTTFGQETPLVQSGWTPCCGNLGMRSLLDHTTEAKTAERYFHNCQSSRTSDPIACGSFWSGNSTPATRISNTSCPFDGDEVCSDEVSPVVLEHEISARSLGYNTPHKVTLHHRLICSPLDLSRFIFPVPGFDEDNKNLLAFLDVDLSIEKWQDHFKAYNTWLETPNGPSRISANYSGWDGKFHRDPYPKGMFLRLIPDDMPDNISSQTNFDTRLRRANSTVFVMLHFAGQTIYRGMGPMTDPIFKASRALNANKNNDLLWLPDREVAGIGCAEQYNLCTEGKECSGWRSTFQNEYVRETPDFLEFGVLSYPLKDFPRDQFLLFFTIFRFSSVYNYMASNRHLPLASQLMNNNAIRYIKQTQWIDELKAIFDTAFLTARFTLIHRVVKIYDKYHCANNPNIFNEDPLFCRSMLFLDGNYTNINVAYLLLFLIPAMGVLAWSFSIETRRRPRHLIGHIENAPGWPKLRNLTTKIAVALSVAWDWIRNRGFSFFPSTFGYGRFFELVFASRVGNRASAT